MTELETMRRAKMYMDKLAQGIDPISGQEVPQDSTLNNVRLARCFFYVSDLLGKVIANGGYVGAKPKKEPFSITTEQLSHVPLSAEPLRITQIVEQIDHVVNDPLKRRLKTTVVTDWLEKKGFLMKQQNADGKASRVPTANGAMIGLSLQTKQGQYGEFTSVYYNSEAQQFVLDNLPAMLLEMGK